MTTNGSTPDLPSILAQLTEAGVTDIKTSALAELIQIAAERQPGVSDERYKVWLRAWLEDRKAEQNAAMTVFTTKKEFRIESHRAAVGLAQASLRSITFMNGGAAVAVLAFIGSLASRIPSNVTYVRDLRPALSMFALGVLISACATGSSYLSQAHFTHADLDTDEHAKRGLKWRRLAIGFAIAGYIAFLAGLCCAYAGLTPSP
jgi:hypothetical protein